MKLTNVISLFTLTNFLLILLLGTAIAEELPYNIIYATTYKASTSVVNIFTPWQTPTYSYEPSIMQDTNPGWKVWFCGGGDFGKNPSLYTLNYGDSIYYADINNLTWGLYTSPEVVLRHTNKDIDADGRGACSPSVIKHSNPFIQNGANLYLLYYECGSRFYDRGNNMQPFNGFTQTCLAVSQDGINWKRYNANNWTNSHTFGGAATPVLYVNQQVLNNCGYKFQNGQYTIDSTTTGIDPDTGKIILTCAGSYFLNDYGVGHPSALTVQTGSSSQIQLYYYDSAGNWANHGVYRVTSWDGFHFSAPQKTNLPNGGTVRYYNSIDNAHSAYVAMTTNNRDNMLLYSTDGLNFVPLTIESTEIGSLDLGVDVPSHCVSPGSPGIVANQSGNISSLNINVVSGEGYLGKFDGGPALGCYSPAEDANRGSTWNLYVMQGTLLLQNPESAIQAGFFRVTDSAPIYYSNENSYCQLQDWQSYLWGGGDANLLNTLDVSSITGSMTNNGICSFPSGFFMVSKDINIYLSNGLGAYCAFSSWAAFIKAGGNPNLSNVWQVTATPSTMQNNGVCN